MTSIRKATASVVAALFLIPATTALGADPAANADPAAKGVVVAEEQQPQPVPVLPAAKPAQDDVSGGNEYTEDTPPTAPAPEPPETPTNDDSNNTQSPSGSTGSVPTATTASETASPAEASDGLPRTGAEGVLIGLIGFTLVVCGTLIRRAAARPN